MLLKALNPCRRVLFQKAIPYSTMVNPPLSEVSANIANVKDVVAQSVAASTLTKRCLLVAASKTKPAEFIKTCVDAGQLDFGENYVNELDEKSHELHEACPSIRWHYIGQVQSNKIPKICNSPGLYAVHTLETEKHCDGFNKEFAKRNKILNVLVQVNTSMEEQKGGLNGDGAMKLADYVRNNCPNLKLIGFMTIGSFDNSHTIPNPDFTSLYDVRAKYIAQSGLSEDDLEISMGMSDDFVQAIAQGSTIVRVGTKIFGERNYNVYV